MSLPVCAVVVIQGLHLVLVMQRTVPATYAPTQEGRDIWLWGASDAVGEGGSGDILTPLYVDEDAIEISGGSKYTIVVLNDGSALAAGFVESLGSYQGHLGLVEDDVAEGSNEFTQITQVYDSIGLSFSSPRFIRGVAGVERVEGSGIIHSVLLDGNGHAYATGSNSLGQLCLGDTDDRFVPERIPIDAAIVSVAVGAEFTLLLDDQGNVHGCGSNSLGQLGLGEGIADTSVPMMNENINGVLSISAGHSHSLFVTDDGLYSSGSNEFGQLCANSNGADVFEPQVIETDSPEVNSFEAIRTSSYILYNDGSLESCGDNEFGQLGDGTNQNQIRATVATENEVVRLLGTGPSASAVFFVTGTSRRMLRSGRYLQQNGEQVWATGLNANGQLGVGDKENRNTPTKVLFATEVSVDQISAGEQHSLAIGVITGTLSPTLSPTTSTPTISPVEEQSEAPSIALSEVPSAGATTEPPTGRPTDLPSQAPSAGSTTSAPTPFNDSGEANLSTRFFGSYKTYICSTHSNRFDRVPYHIASDSYN